MQRRVGVPHAAALVLAMLCVGPLASAEPGSDAAIEQAKVVANAWLTKLDAGQYEESWNEAAPAVQSSVSRSDWASKVAQVRQPFGALKSRELQDSTFTHSLPGAPDGDYVVIRYHSSFANKADALETVTPMKTSDGHWHVSGYYLR